MENEKLMKANSLLSNGEFDNAKVLYELLLLDEPDNIDYLTGMLLSTLGAKSLTELSLGNVYYKDDEYFKKLYFLGDEELVSCLDSCVDRTIKTNIKKGYEQLERQNISFARSFFDLVLTYDKENSQALIGMMYCDLKVFSLEMAIQKRIKPSESKWYDKVLSTCDEEYKSKLLDLEKLALEHLATKKKNLKIGIIIGSIALIIALAVCVTIFVIMSNKRAEYERTPAYSLNIKEVEGGVEIGRIKNTHYIVDGVLEIPEYIDGKRVVGIGKNAFYNQDDIRKVILPDSIKYINEHAFQFCDNLEEVSLPDSLTEIGFCAFAYSNIKEIILPDSLTVLANTAFSSTKLTTVTVPGSIQVLESQVFHNCPITSAVICEGVTTIEESVFGNIDELTLPSTITTISLNPVTSVRNISAPISSLSVILERFKPYSVTITNGTNIPSNVFADNLSIRSVILGDTVTSISTNAFRGCSSLNSIVFNNKVTRIDSYAFNGCSSLTTIDLPSSLTHIGSFVFDGCNISSIFIPRSVQAIESFAFAGLSQFTIYCEISQSDIPSGWSQYWNLKSYTNQQAAYDVYWDYKK